MKADHKTWWEVKGKITALFGSVSACATTLRCSPDGIRKAVEGQCPGIAKRLKEELQYDWQREEVAA